MRIGKSLKTFFFGKRGMNSVVSSVIMAGVAITLGFAVLGWTQIRAEEQNNNYSEITDSNINKLQEKIVFEYVKYENNHTLSVYLFNCGENNDISIVGVYLSNDTWIQKFDNIELKFFNGTPTDDLDYREEGYFLLNVNLSENTNYSVRIMTYRGRSFVRGFIA